jgi:hypothetical protein
MFSHGNKSLFKVNEKSTAGSLESNGFRRVNRQSIFPSVEVFSWQVNLELVGHKNYFFCWEELFCACA